MILNCMMEFAFCNAIHGQCSTGEIGSIQCMLVAFVRDRLINVMQMNDVAAVLE